ncbi:replication endonuclease [Trinickia sp. EG282A]|uniref:replication endonuclease n=1 Tax=Trinickia sp. EG282A TaxID=3237013 RepID=UPI0034D34F3D
MQRLDLGNRDWKTANSYLREHVADWSDAVFRLDASLDDIRSCAARRAGEAAALVERLGSLDAIVAALQALCARWKVAYPDVDTDGGAVARVLDPGWWNRRLRVAHCRKVENQAIRLGLVSAKGDKYLTLQNLRRGRAQDERNAHVMANTLAINEDGECFSLAELIAKSVSNKVIRRGELMLRMRGMEEVARELACVAEFDVITAPSRFHAVRANGQPNEKYERENTPRECQAYLSGQFAKLRSWCHRHRIPFFGLRTVEAHQDGTPHWNVLVFLPDEAARQAWRMALVHYFLDNDSADEDGARERRLRMETIDEAKGDATGYIAKYISKNVDGHGLTEDLAGDPIMQTVQRVEQWAKLHGIRMFQPIGGGGAPVTLWREMRRIKGEGASLAGAPEAMQRAWIAAQRVPGAVEGEEDKRADFAEFIRAYGGPYVKRQDAALALYKEAQAGLGKYGEPLDDRPAGIIARGLSAVDMGGLVGVIQVADKVYRSERRQWIIQRRAQVRSVSAGAERAPSRTRVNNCTEEGQHGHGSERDCSGNGALHQRREARDAARARGEMPGSAKEAPYDRALDVRERTSTGFRSRERGRSAVIPRDSRDFST